jgi:predicted ATPase
LYGLWNFYITRADFQSASALAAQMLSLAETAQEPAFLLAAHNAQMQTLVEQGALLSARAHMERVLGLYDPEKHHVLVEVYGEDFGVSCRVLAIVLMWQLGYPEQALHHAQAVREIAERVSHPLSLAQALYFGAMLHVYLRDSPSVQQLVGVLLPLCREHGLSFWLAGGQVLQGWASVQAGQTEDGITAIRQGIADWRAIGAQIWLPILRSMLVEAYACARQPVEGLAVVEEALAGTRTTGEVFFDAELYRLRGELMLQSQTGPRPVQGKSRAGQRKSQAPNT